MTFNYLLLWTIGFTVGVVVFRSIHRGSQVPRGWLGVSLAVGALTTLLFFVTPESAGYFGGILWGIFLLLPGLLSKKLFNCMMSQQWDVAKRLSRIMSLLHPFDGWRDLPRLFEALEGFSKGDEEASTAVLLELAQGGGNLAGAAVLHSLALRGVWGELEEFLRERIHGDLDRIAPFQIPYYLRALGELGQYDEMVEQFSRLRGVLRSKHDSYHYFLSSMMVFAFCGDGALVRLIFQGPLRKLPEDAQAFWVATAELTVGNYVAANEEFQRLYESSLVTIRTGARTRNRERVPVFVHEASELTRTTLVELKESVSALLALSHEIQSGRGRPVMCIALSILTVLAYGVQMLNNATLNVFALHQLGALFPPDVFMRGEYWRLIAPLFLHAGATHLFANLFGLLILGPFVERYVGRIAFTLLYLGSGVLSLSAVVMLAYHGVLTPRVLVGASGAVMGLVGATVAIFIGLWSRFKQAEAFRQARSAALIIFFQLIFDIATPQVSLTAHLSGAFAGLLLGGAFLIFRQQKVTRSSQQG